MIRKQIAKKYINVDDIHHVIWHSSSIFIAIITKNIIFLWVLYILFFVLSKYVTWQYFAWIFWIFGIALFVKFIIDFFNLYLDSLILSSNWITLFLREWLLEYKTDFFERWRIETVSHTQNDLRDKIFIKWDLLIKLEHWIQFPFENVSNPKKQISKILKLKDSHLLKNKEEKKDLNVANNEQMSILAEALSEVVKEYLDKNTERN